MTEERRIVTESIFYDRDSPNIEFYFLEQAPPKDWKPVCYELEMCTMCANSTYYGYAHKDCPFRKKEFVGHFTQEEIKKKADAIDAWNTDALR